MLQVRGSKSLSSEAFSLQLFFPLVSAALEAAETLSALLLFVFKVLES